MLNSNVTIKKTTNSNQWSVILGDTTIGIIKNDYSYGNYPYRLAMIINNDRMNFSFSTLGGAIRFAKKEWSSK